MARDSLRVFEHFDDLIGGSCGFTPTGMLVLADEQSAEAIRTNVQLQQEQGVKTRMIALSEVAEIAPDYSSVGAAAACYEEDAGVADPMATT